MGLETAVALEGRDSGQGDLHGVPAPPAVEASSDVTAGGMTVDGYAEPAVPETESGRRKRVADAIQALQDRHYEVRRALQEKDGSYESGRNVSHAPQIPPVLGGQVLMHLGSTMDAGRSIDLKGAP